MTILFILYRQDISKYFIKTFFQVAHLSLDARQTSLVTLEAHPLARRATRSGDAKAT
jgi:hypothetical protein